MAERVLNVVWGLLGFATMVNGYSLGLKGSYGPDSGLFPLICGAIILVCGLTLTVRFDATREAAPAWPRGTAVWRVLGVIAGLVCMAAILPYLGFAISSSITTFVLLQTVERSRLIESVVITAVSVAAVMGIFGHLLGMSLPRGPWGW